MRWSQVKSESKVFHHDDFSSVRNCAVLNLKRPTVPYLSFHVTFISQQTILMPEAMARNVSSNDRC